MAEINGAYEVLTDDEKRAQVDAGVDPNNPMGGAQYYGGSGTEGFPLKFFFNEFENMQHGGGGGGGGPFRFTFNF